MRVVEIFSAGCPCCLTVIDLVNQMSCPSCDVSILDMHDQAVNAKAASLGIAQVPAVVVDGTLVAGLDENILRAAGIGQAGA